MLAKALSGTLLMVLLLGSVQAAEQAEPKPASSQQEQGRSELEGPFDEELARPLAWVLGLVGVAGLIGRRTPRG